MNKNTSWIRRNWKTILISFSLGFVTSCCTLFYLLVWIGSSSVVTSTSTARYNNTIQETNTSIILPLQTPLYTPIQSYTPEALNTDTPTPTPFPSMTLVPAIVFPTQPEHPQGTTGQCQDGTYTSAQHKQGACSHHGGVAKWWGN